MRHSRISLVFLVLGSFLAVAGDGGFSDNEDVQFIKNWQRTQKINALVSELSLSAEQVNELKAIKEAVEQVKADYQVLLDEFLETSLATAAEIRARLEATDQLSEEDAALIKAFRQDRRALGQEKRAGLIEATAGLRDLLTEEQIALLISKARGNRADREQEGKGKPQRQGGQRAKARLARLLLSDAFLAAIED